MISGRTAVFMSGGRVYSASTSVKRYIAPRAVAADQTAIIQRSVRSPAHRSSLARESLNPFPMDAGSKGPSRTRVGARTSPGDKVKAILSGATPPGQRQHGPTCLRPGAKSNGR